MSTVDGDPEETKGRSGLARCVTTAPTTPDYHFRTFEKIEELFKKLLVKSALSRFADKGGFQSCGKTHRAASGGHLLLSGG